MKIFELGCVGVIKKIKPFYKAKDSSYYPKYELIYAEPFTIINLSGSRANLYEYFTIV